MSPSITMDVVVLEHRKMGKPCTEGCGTDWLVEENQKLAQELVEKAFGTGVSLRFVNLAEPGAEDANHEIVEKVRTEGMVLPALVINGEVKIAGYFDLRMLNDMIDATSDLE